MTFVSLAAMVAICGAAGLIFFERIAGSVSTQSEITSPLLIESIALIHNAENMRLTVLEGVSRAEASGDDQRSLNKLDADARRHVATLKFLSVRAGLWPRFEPIEQLRIDFVASLRDIVRSRSALVSAEQAIVERYSRVDSKALLANVAMRALAQQLKTKLSENEVVVRAATRSGTATPDAISALFLDTVGFHSLLQDVDAVAQATVRAQHLAQSVIAAGGQLDLTHVRGEVQRLFLANSVHRESLTAYIRGQEQQSLLTRINASQNELQEAFIGPDGLLARKKESLTLAARLAARLKKLSEIQARYLDVLAGVAESVRGRNEASIAQTSRIIDRGRSVILLVVGLAAVLGIAAAVFLARGITAPLKRLTTHVRGIRGRGALTEISDRYLVGARDEFGDLSRSFNRMISEVAEARAQLIATSGAEIGKHVKRLEAALTNMAQGLSMFDDQGQLIVANSKYAQSYGIAPERIYPGMTFRKILEEQLAAGGFYGDATSYVERRLLKSVEVKNSDSTVVLQNGRSIHIVRRQMEGSGWVATHEDVTERRQIEAKIAHMARHDALTGLPNRVLLREKIEEALVSAKHGARFAVHCLDLDYFKGVNDTLGHSMGDALLRSVTDRLMACLRDGDTISRLGGDEFVIIQSVTEPQIEASAFARRIVSAISEPYDLDAHQVVIGVSIGIAIAPEDGGDPDELLKNADLALYRAKADGRGNWRFFEPEMHARMQLRRGLERDLRQALALGEFELHYQPLINVKSGEITGFEALLRWNHPTRGLVPPADFITVAEDIGLIVPLGEWVLRHACQEAAKWPPSIHVAVNLSPVQFKSGNLVTAVTLALSSAKLSSSRLELEITESLLLEDSSSTLATLHSLKALGARICMDDFGTGYSSLSYLRSFPFDKIKIDRSFIRDLADNDDAIAIVRAITSLGNSLGMTTTAEGVETREQLERLQVEGCTEFQGYLFSAARPAGELAALLASVPKSGMSRTIGRLRR